MLSFEIHGEFVSSPHSPRGFNRASALAANPPSLPLRSCPDAHSEPQMSDLATDGSPSNRTCRARHSGASTLPRYDRTDGTHIADAGTTGPPPALHPSAKSAAAR